MDRTKGSNNHKRLEEALPNSAPRVNGKVRYNCTV